MTTTSDFKPEERDSITTEKTSIPGLLKLNLQVFGDQRGWFKENYQAEKLHNLGIPKDFNPVQNNISFNAEKGTIRGIHAEPWNKYISVGYGQVFAAIVDLREGESFGSLETFFLDPQTAIYVPAGCGNSFQTLTDNVVYTYLVDAHWSPESQYTMVNLADADLSIDWPIPLQESIMSEKDAAHPSLSEVNPIKEAN